MVERRVRAILEIIYEARNQGDQGKLDHAKTLATRTKKEHLVEVSLVSIERGIDEIHTFGCRSRALNKTKV